MTSHTLRHAVTLPQTRLRTLAQRIISLAPSTIEDQSTDQPIKVVCVSDTHNQQPVIPHGDLLLHAGDLTEWGSFDEIQKQLSWLSSLPHEHKVIIAGNHDVFFDHEFLASEKERFPVTEGRTAADLDFGNVIYLQDSIMTLSFATIDRELTVYGSPWTPQYVKSAFQYAKDADIWTNKLPPDIDVLLTHGPPRGHLDGFRRAGCPYLAQAIEERRPRLVVFGHIHVGQGREAVVRDRLRRLYEEVERGWCGWEVVPLMSLLLISEKASSVLRKMFGKQRIARRTELINAAVVGESNQICNDASITYI